MCWKEVFCRFTHTKKKWKLRPNPTFLFYQNSIPMLRWFSLLKSFPLFCYHSNVQRFFPLLLLKDSRKIPPRVAPQKKRQLTRKSFEQTETSNFPHWGKEDCNVRVWDHSHTNPQVPQALFTMTEKWTLILSLPPLISFFGKFPGTIFPGPKRAGKKVPKIAFHQSVCFSSGFRMKLNFPSLPYWYMCARLSWERRGEWKTFHSTDI